MTNDSFCKLVESTDEFISNIALSLNINENQAITAVSKFFKERPIIVQQYGIEGYAYKLGTYIQTTRSTTMGKTLFSNFLEPKRTVFSKNI